MTPRILVIGPNRQAIKHAKEHELVPREAFHITHPNHIAGYDDIIIYLVKYALRTGAIWEWGSRTGNKQLVKFMDAVAPMRNKEIREVTLP